jgi:hypothetical protein
MARLYAVIKMQKVTGKRQTWGLHVARLNASARVWDRVPDTTTFYKASDAMAAACQQFDHDGATWTRHAGRGSAYFTKLFDVA